MNSINLMGRLTANVELKQTPAGISVCTFTIAVKRPHTKDVTDFIPCVAWRETAEFISRFFWKGRMIAVSGALTHRRYEDRDGSKHNFYEVLVSNADFCGDKQDSAQTAPQQEQAELEEAGAEDLPF